MPVDPPISIPPSPPAPPSPYEAAAGGTHAWPRLLMLAAFLVVIYFLRYTLLPFVFAAGAACLIAPVLDWLERHLRLRRWVISLLLFIGFLAVLGLLGWWLYSVILPQSLHLLSRRHRLLVNGVAEFSRLIHARFDAEEVANRLQADLHTVFGNPSRAAQYLTISISTVGGFFLFLVLLLYFLLDGARLIRGLTWMVPPGARPRARLILSRLYPMILRYIGGLTVIVIYTFAVSWIGLGVVLHLSNAVLLALVTALLEPIPVVGPAVCIVLLSLVALEHGSVWLAMGLAVFVIVLRLSIDQVVGPLVLGKAVTLHPVAIIFAFLCGGALFGIIGVLLAVPAAGALKIVLSILYEEPASNSAPNAAAPD